MDRITTCHLLLSAFLRAYVVHRIPFTSISRSLDFPILIVCLALRPTDHIFTVCHCHRTGVGKRERAFALQERLAGLFSVNRKHTPTKIFELCITV